MIANPTILKIGGGAITLGGLGGAGYVFKEEIIGFFSKTCIEHYWAETAPLAFKGAVAAVSGTAKNTPPPLPEIPSLYKDNDKVKNYWCKDVVTNKIDKTCEIFELKDKREKLQIDAIDIQKKIKTSIKNISDITDTKYYEFKVNAKNLKSENKPLTNIKLIEAKEGATAHTFETFNLILRIDNLTENTKSNMLLGKAKISATISDINGYSCKFGKNSETEYECSIYKFDETAVTKAVDLDFSEAEKATNSLNANTGKNEYYAVVFDEEKIKQISFEDRKNTIIFAKKSDSTATSIEFIFQSFLFGKFAEQKTENRIAII